MRRSWGWDPERALSWAQGAKGEEAFQTPYVTGSANTVTERILALGATKLWDGRQGPQTWVTYADPEGNEFCLSAM